MCSKSVSHSYAFLVLVKPRIENCEIKLYVTEGSNEKVVKTLSCSAENVDPIPQWILHRNLSHIEVSYVTEVDDSSFELPWVDYISSSSVGIANTWFTVDFDAKGKNQLYFVHNLGLHCLD